jgi:hypothetical protein
MKNIDNFNAVLKTIKNRKIMTKVEDDGVYVRLAGSESNGEIFSKEWVKIYPECNASYAKRELDILSKSHTDPENRPLIEFFTPEIIALCAKFNRSGQSGGSAPYTATAISQALKKLLLFEPICPITGIDEEWNDITRINNDIPMFQNNRDSRIFKDGKDGKPYFIDAIIKKTQTGDTWHGWFWTSKEAYLAKDESQHISPRGFIKSFPFVPKTFYIDVIEEEVGPDDWEMYIKDIKQLEKVYKYYDREE